MLNPAFNVNPITIIKDRKEERYYILINERLKSIYRHVIGGKHKLANLILHKDKEKIWEKNMFENVQRHYSSLFSSIFEEDFGLRGHNEFQSLECYQFVAGEDSSGKYIEFTGRSTKNFKEGLAH